MNDSSLPAEFMHSLEFAEAEAWADEFATAPENWGCKIIQIGGAYMFLVPQYDNFIYNKVIGLGLTEPASEDMIVKISKLYQEAGIQNYAFQISPNAHPSSIAEWLAKHGIKPTSNWVKLYCHTDHDVTATTDLRIEKIGPDYAYTYSHIFCEVFELPEAQRAWIASLIGQGRWSHYLAFDGNFPVATGALYTNGQFGALLGATTLPSHRKRGAQSALLAKRINDARGMGSKWIVTETWQEKTGQHNPSYHNMLRAGFKLAYIRPNFMRKN